MKLLQKILLIIIFSCKLVTDVSAQDVTVKATADTNAILMGQQFTVNLQIAFPSAIKVQWPVFNDSLGSLQVVERGKVDTLSNAAIVQLYQKIKVTGFDSGQQVIPPFDFSYRKPADTTNYIASTIPLNILINTLPVDTTKEFKDIKGPITVPYTFADFVPYIIAVVLLVLLIWLVVYYLKKSRQKTIVPEKYVPKTPAHEIALSELVKLREEKLWQQGNIKEYHTRLTDIVRAYIERRYKINALEFTTDELLNSIAIRQLDSDNFSKLKFLLEVADLVKFAKALPLPGEHEQCLTHAFEFVNATKPVQQPAAVKEGVS